MWISGRNATAFFPSPGTPGEGRGEGLLCGLPQKSPHPCPLPEYRERGDNGLYPPSRRQILRRMAGGFGMVGLAGILGPQALAGSFGAASGSAAVRHLAPRAKRVI